MSRFALSKVYIAVTTDFTFADPTVCTLNFPPPGVTFDHEQFWNTFFDKNQPSDVDDALRLVVDAARFHFSPNVKSLPGVTISFNKTEGTTTNPVNITLPAGYSRVAAFSRTKGSLYSYTYVCLATAAIYAQLYLSLPASRTLITTSKPNMWKGCSTYMGLIAGFTEAHQKECEDVMEKWVTDIGLKARNAKLDIAIKSAARKTITERAAGRIHAAIGIQGFIQLAQGKPVTDFNSTNFITYIDTP